MHPRDVPRGIWPLALKGWNLNINLPVLPFNSLFLYFLNQYYLFIGAYFLRNVWSWTMLRIRRAASVKNIT